MVGDNHCVLYIIIIRTNNMGAYKPILHYTPGLLLVLPPGSPFSFSCPALKN